MKIRHGTLALAWTGVAAFAAGCEPRTTRAPEPAPSTAPSGAASSAPAKASSARFPDFGFMVSPAEYHAKYQDQPIFRLKSDVPREKPSKLPAFLEKLAFDKEPLAYLEAARDYSFDGNLPNWDPFANRKAQWFHIPWLHPDLASDPPNGGTEGFHGLI